MECGTLRQKLVCLMLFPQLEVYPSQQNFPGGFKLNGHLIQVT